MIVQSALVLQIGESTARLCFSEMGITTLLTCIDLHVSDLDGDLLVPVQLSQEPWSTTTYERWGWRRCSTRRNHFSRSPCSNAIPQSSAERNIQVCRCLNITNVKQTNESLFTNNWSMSCSNWQTLKYLLGLMQFSILEIHINNQISWHLPHPN